MLVQCGLIRFLFFHLLSFGLVLLLHWLGVLNLPTSSLAGLVMNIGALTMLFFSNTNSGWRSQSQR